MAQIVKSLPKMWETQVQSLRWEDFLKKEMATHSSILAWKIPWTEEPGRLQSIRLQRVGYSWATSLSLSWIIAVIIQGNCTRNFYHWQHLLKTSLSDFPGGPVVKNLPCNAGDAGSIPGQGTKIPYATEQPSLYGHRFSLLLDTYLAVELLGHT